jgi:hypothetical protein
MAKKSARAAAADDLDRLRQALRGGAHMVRGAVLGDDGPLGDPAPMRQSAGGWVAYAPVPSDHDVIVTGLRLEAELDGETVTADVRLPPATDPADGDKPVPRIAPAGTIAHCFIPDEPGLGQQGE